MQRAMTARRTAAWLALVFAGAACNGAPERGRSVQTGGGARVGGAVISTVDGQPITVGDVRDLVLGSGLSPEEALRKLQAERLLMIEAGRRGFEDAEPVRLVAEQARVQALLEAVAQAVTVGEEEVRAAYEKGKARFERAERRMAVHVLASPPKDATPEADAAARAYAAEVIPKLAQATDVRAFIAGLKNIEMPLFKVGAESLPAFPRTAPLVKEFIEAMFSLPAPGVVSEPIKTRYGWHAIRVVRIDPAFHKPYEEVAETLRAELLLERRKRAVEDLLTALRARHRVELSPTLRETLAALEL